MIEWRGELTRAATTTARAPFDVALVLFEDGAIEFRYLVVPRRLGVLAWPGARAGIQGQAAGTTLAGLLTLDAPTTVRFTPR